MALRLTEMRGMGDVFAVYKGLRKVGLGGLSSESCIQIPDLAELEYACLFEGAYPRLRRIRIYGGGRPPS